MHITQIWLVVLLYLVVEIQNHLSKLFNTNIIKLFKEIAHPQIDYFYNLYMKHQGFGGMALQWKARNLWGERLIFFFFLIWHDGELSL